MWINKNARIIITTKTCDNKCINPSLHSVALRQRNVFLCPIFSTWFFKWLVWKVSKNSPIRCGSHYQASLEGETSCSDTWSQEHMVWEKGKIICFSNLIENEHTTYVCVYESVEKTFVRFYDFLFYFACSEIPFFFSLPQGNVMQ